MTADMAFWYFAAILAVLGLIWGLLATIRAALLRINTQIGIIILILEDGKPMMSWARRRAHVHLSGEIR